MTPAELRERCARFARDVHPLCNVLAQRSDAQNAARQLREASSSAAANHRAAGRGRSHREFTAKLGLALEECDESVFWLEHIQACRLADDDQVAPLLAEARQLAAILTTSYRTAGRNDGDPPRRRKRQE